MDKTLESIDLLQNAFVYLDTSNNTASIIFWNGLLSEATSSKMKNRSHDEHAFGKERIALSVVVGQLKNSLNICYRKQLKVGKNRQ